MTCFCVAMDDRHCGYGVSIFAAGESSFAAWESSFTAWESVHVAGGVSV